MELKISRESVLREFGLASRLSERKSTIPIFSYALLDMGIDHVTMSATDGETMLRTQLTAEGGMDDGTSLVVPVKQLHEIARQSVAKDITLTLKDNRLSVKAGSFRSNLGIRDAAEFPVIPKEPPEWSGLSAKLLRSAVVKVKGVVEAAATSAVQNATHGALLKLADQKMLMAATDGRRLAQVTVERTGSESDVSAVIPRKALNDLAAFLAADETLESVQFAKDEARLYFTSGPRQLITRELVYKFPAYENILTRADGGSSINVDRDAWLSAVKRVMLVYSDHAVKVKVEISDGLLTMSMANAEMGETSEPVSAELFGPGWTAGFNAQYLADFLASSEEGTVTLKQCDTLGAPGIFTGAPGDVHYTYVLMPISI